ncbi:MAG: flagellar export protein FliJ [Oceanospirillales bacterium]|uniref:Flagellar FliJ protein n=1 Tax=Marinobacterium halophilum TaxID=267374 RepID=A0A2P8ES99_9GAMM|nr:flagellar export protein FliJ [Marinobacterium halophilum]MBR9828787.1 flagellar export protein FliJ [Oceanospirillales bacterium]PSL12366.1 flagellar FliJ protein [Marinobacterium halophilum]
MTKPRSQRLQVVLAVAERKRQEAERFLADAQRRVNQGENGIVQLQGYLGEYQQQFTATGREGISIQDLHVQQAFMQKITHTMQEQEQALQQARDQVQQVQAYWQQTYARQKGIENLVQKAQNEESHERDRKLQQEIDERSQHVRPRYI